jgi:2-(1,2-epoxy-1,2-dihydrophenyl)acetyl-CoA isomerase
MDPVVLTLDGSVARIVLNRPERKNALDTSAWRGLERALATVAGSADVRILILSGAGGNFSAGADVSGDSTPSHPTQLERMEWFNQVVLALHRLPIPTIAKVDGLAVGVGMNLALACDFVIASRRARFSQIFIKRALSVDGGGSWLLPRLVGLQRAKAMCLKGDMFDADSAAEMGVVSWVVEADRLDQEVNELAETLCNNSRLAMAQTKRLLNEAGDLDLEQAMQNEARAQAINVASEEFAAAIAQFTAGADQGKKETVDG